MTEQTRREFLQSTAGAAGLAAWLHSNAGAGAGAAANAPTPKLEQRNVVAGMKYNRLGRTHIAVSALSSGVAKAPVLAAAIERGVNFVHTAFGYNNVPDVAEVAAKHRDKMFIGIKVGPVEDYLKALRVDYVDVLFMSRMGAQDARDSRGRIRENFERMKQQGKVRFLGLTIHSDDLVGATQAAVESDTWDIVMPQYQPQLRAQLDPILAKARAKNIGVLAMKTMINVPERAIEQHQAILRTALASGHIDSVIRSLASFEVLSKYIEAATTPVRAEDASLLQAATAQMKGRRCGSCGRCAACPQGVSVAEILKCKDYYAGQMGEVEFARAVYGELAESQRASNCGDCGRCEAACSEGLMIRRLLRDAHALLGYSVA